MLHFYSGDREKARAAMQSALDAHKKKGAAVVRVSDASPIEDVHAALGAHGMFDAAARVVVLDGVFANDEIGAAVLDLLPALAESDDTFFLFEEKPDAATRKMLEKYAESSEKFAGTKSVSEDNFFALTNAFQRGEKKKLWLLMQRELLSGKAPEMLHGSLFWAAKQMALKPHTSSAIRGKALVAALAELPHEARRRGEELEYALERFVLSPR